MYTNWKFNIQIVMHHHHLETQIFRYTFLLLSKCVLQENTQFAKASILGDQKHHSWLCISCRISIDGTVHQADFDSYAWFVAMTLPDHFLSHGCCSNQPLIPPPYLLSDLHCSYLRPISQLWLKIKLFRLIKTTFFPPSCGGSDLLSNVVRGNGYLCSAI